MEEFSLEELGLENGITPLTVVDNTSPPPTEDINAMLGTQEPNIATKPLQPSSSFQIPERRL